MEHSNIQTYFILIKSPKREFVVGTPTQRGFTEVGVAKAIEQVKQKLPKGWQASVVTVNPISALF
jgi:hypothetical protein